MQTFLPINKCIYCGETNNLTDEHIVPFSLNGTWILPKSSCLDCAKITSAFEGRVAKMFASFRQSSNLKTRRPKKKKQTISLRDDRCNIIEMPNEGMWDIIPTFKFSLPGIYNKDWNLSKKWEETTLGIMTNHPNETKLSHWKKFSTNTFIYESSSFDINSYALMLAKIGHCIAVGHYGFDNFDHFLTPFILGNDKVNFSLTLDSPNLNTKPNSLISINLSYFVGSFNEILPPKLFDHEYGFELQKSDIPNVQYLIYSRVRLFPFAGGPTACVVVGKANQQQYLKCLNHQK
jgi:hypothetical protein